MGRPSEYNSDVAALICARLAEGKTLREVCRADDMPAESTVRGWVLDDREGFSAQYARAREVGYHAMADEVIEIADGVDTDAANKRIRFDARRWLLSKALPKVYGDKIEQTLQGGDKPIETKTIFELTPFSIADRK